jgi:hypothetical protein
MAAYFDVSGEEMLVDWSNKAATSMDQVMLQHSLVKRTCHTT